MKSLFAHAREPRTGADAAVGGFRHEACFYSDLEGFLAHTAPFLQAGLRNGDAMLVIVDEERIDLLRSALGRDSSRIRFTDVRRLGGNPARIIPAWHEFADEFGDNGTALRGIGEPVWSRRSRAELVECDRHEALLNLAFANSGQFHLLCPYDGGLSAEVLDAARRNHPVVEDGGLGQTADAAPYEGDERALSALLGSLPAPEGAPLYFAIERGSLFELRRFVMSHALGAGLADEPAARLTLAVNELATNSVRHGGGRGALRCWEDGDAVIYEVTDEGVIEEPLVGRKRPTHDQQEGRGLWLAHQLCDLVQLRSGPTGTVVRVHMYRD